MKAALFALALLVSVPASAACNLTWNDVNGRNTAQVDGVWFADVATQLYVTDVCKAGDVVKSKQPVEVCVRPGTGESSRCLETEARTLVTKINYEKEVPHGEAGFITVPFTIPMNYEIQVGPAGDGFHPIGCINYTIAECGQDAR